jgi:hypothetical protein
LSTHNSYGEIFEVFLASSREVGKLYLQQIQNINHNL